MDLPTYGIRKIYFESIFWCTYNTLYFNKNDMFNLFLANPDSAKFIAIMNIT